MQQVQQYTVAEPWLWFAFVAGVIVLLLFDLFVLHKEAKKIQFREAMLASLMWIAIALAFNGWFAWEFGAQLGLEFLTGYVVEKSLSMDNLFVMLLIFSAFAIPSQYQYRVLFWGILGAIIMRGTLILVGVGLLHRFEWIMYVFGAILIYSAIKFLRDSDDEFVVTEHWAVRVMNRIYPLTNRIEGQKFFVIEEGIRKGTPLLVALVVIEFTDLVFAVDSIPAVLAITDDAFIAFASNILALLGLRALYFVIADLVSKLRYLKPGLALVLGFVGVKMLIMEWYKFPAWVSLLVITGILTTAALGSWYVTHEEGKRGPPV
jgi:tellurite resistance protein TerC